MTTEIISKQALPPTVPQEKYELVKELYAKGCTENEFQVFTELANRYGLDPFAHQIWAIKGYGNAPAQIIVARDGYLAVAHRSGQFDGMSDPEYETDEKGKVTHVRVRVYRKDMTHPFTGDAWDDEDNLHQSVWNKRQRTMLLKVAESRALRKAFSLSGTYCPEELGYDENTPYKIDPKPSDIVVENIKPAIQPAQTSTTKTEPVKAEPKAIYTAEMVRNTIIPNYQQHNFPMDAIKQALLPDGNYDQEIIAKDYMDRINAIKTSDPAPKKKEPESLEEFTAEALDGAKKLSKQPVCFDCKKVKVFPDEEFESNAKYGVPLCKDCMSKRISADLKKKQEAKAAEPKPEPKTEPTPAPASTQTKPTKVDENVCSVCGKKMTKAEVTKWQMFNKGKPLVCSDCASKPAEN